MFFTPEQHELLLSQQTISDRHPWSTNNESTIDSYIESMLSSLRDKLGLKDKTEFGHYGSGYASYVDCWLFRESNEFRIGSENHYCGLVVLFSRLCDCYALAEGQKSWHDRGGSSYLPSFQSIDVFSHPPVQKLSDEVAGVLQEFQLNRLTAEQLCSTVPQSYKIPTILADPPWHEFDVVFYWED